MRVWNKVMLGVAFVGLILSLSGVGITIYGLLEFDQEHPEDRCEDGAYYIRETSYSEYRKQGKVIYVSQGQHCFSGPYVEEE